MATVSMIFGGTLGFFTAVIGILVFGATAWQAFGLWWGTGLETSLILMSVASIQRAAASKGDPTGRMHA